MHDHPGNGRGGVAVSESLQFDGQKTPVFCPFLAALNQALGVQRPPRMESMKKIGDNWICTVITVLMTASFISGSAEATIRSEVEKKGDLPTLVYSGLFNPFPALYVLDDKKRLVLHAQGPEDARFSREAILRQLESAEERDAPLSEAQSSYLWSLVPPSAEGKTVAIFLTIDASMGRSDVAEEILESTRAALAEARREFTVVVVRAGN